MISAKVHGMPTPTTHVMTFGWLLAGYVLACGSPPRTAEQEVAFQDSIAAIRTHREFQAMQAVEAERARRDSIQRESKRVATARGQAAGRAVRSEHERWRRCVVATTKDSMSTGEPYMETATSDDVRAKCGDPR